MARFTYGFGGASSGAKPLPELPPLRERSRWLVVAHIGGRATQRHYFWYQRDAENFAAGIRAAASWSVVLVRRVGDDPGK